MRIAVDTHHLLLENAGTKRITVNFIEQLYKVQRIEVLELKPSYRLRRGKSIPGKILGHLIRFFWVHLHLPVLCYLKRVGVLVSPEFNTPFYTNCKRVVIVPDAHMRAQREFTSTLWFYCYYVPFIESAIRRADLIITISEFAKKQIVNLMNLDDAKVHVVYLGIDASFLVAGTIGGADEVVRQKGLIPKNYILFVGTFEARKNLERLIKAFSKVKRKNLIGTENLQLAIVGKPAGGMFSDRSRQMAELINKLSLEKDVVLTGYVADNDLPKFYRMAKLLAFPSLHEGFGFPIIEGFVSEVPVITSDLCSMPEIAGEAALIVDPYNVDDITDKIEHLLVNSSLRERLVDAGTQRVKEFTWEKFTDEVLFKVSSLTKK